jgi:outer membrane protein assembly factor BamB
MKTLTTILSVFFMSLTLSFAQNWPNVGGDLQRSSYKEIGLEFPLEVAMEYNFSTGGNEQGLCIYVDGIYASIASDSNIIMGLDLESGDSLWTFGIPGSGGAANYNPAASGDIVLGGGQGGTGLFGINRYTGEELWVKPMGSLYTRNPMVDDTLIFIGMDSFYCLHLETGKTIWSLPGPYSQLSPCIDDQNVYVSIAGVIQALNKHTGSLVGQIDSIPNSSYTSLSSDETQLYVGWNNRVRAINKQTGIPSWDIRGNHFYQLMYYPSAFAVTPSHLVIKHLLENNVDSSAFTVVDKETGAIVSEWILDWLRYSAPTIVDSFLIDVHGQSVLFLNYMTGDTVYAHILDQSSNTLQPVIANNKIFLGGSRIVALKSKTAAVNQVEPTVQKLSIFPNPGKNHFRIDTGSTELSKTGKISVVNLSGKIVLNRNIELLDGKADLLMHRIPSGIYKVSLKVDSDLYSGKWLKIE